MARVGNYGLLTSLVLASTLVLAASCQTVFDGELGPVYCSNEGAFGPPACPPNESCIAGKCSAGARPLGAECSTNSDCAAPAFCLDPASLGEVGPPHCSMPCCSSSDCGPAEGHQICRPSPGVSGKLCWPAPERGVLSIGQGLGGSDCTTDSDCRSAVCDVGRCADVCCDDTACAGGSVCRIRRIPQSEDDVWSCGPPPVPPTLECNDDDDCASGLCIPLDSQLSVCAQPCCSMRDCGNADVQGELRPLRCAPAPPEGEVLACSQAAPAQANKVLGQSCSGASECRSGLCQNDGNASYCTDSCCSDSDCQPGIGLKCRPIAVDGTWPLRCVRK